MSKTNINKFENLVKFLLTEKYNLRDNTGLLYVACVDQIMGNNYIKETSLYDHFKNPPKNAILPTVTTVIRLSTKVQKENIHLRGDNWVERQKHSTAYRKDLGYIT